MYVIMKLDKDGWYAPRFEEFSNSKEELISHCNSLNCCCDSDKWEYKVFELNEVKQ